MSTEALMECAKAGAQGTDLPTSAPDLEALVAAARRHNCLSIVAGPIRSRPDCSPALLDRLDRVQTKAWARHLITAATIGPVLKTASDEGMTIVVYKGAAHAVRYYARPWIRSMADIDILLSEDQKKRLCEILSGRGFRLLVTPGRALTGTMSHEHSYAAPTPGVRALDIHTSPAPPSRYDLPVRAMIARSVPGVLFDAPVRFFTPEDDLLVTAVNQAYDHFRLGFVRYLDIWLSTQRATIDWRYLVSVAKQAGAATATWLTLSNANRLAGVVIPKEVLGELQPSTIRRAWVRTLLNTEGWGVGDPRFSLPRRIEQLLLVYPLIDRPTKFARFAGFHGGLRLLDAFDKFSRPKGTESVPDSPKTY